MRSSKGLLGRRNGRSVIEFPNLGNYGQLLLQYLETKDRNILSDILWDTILIKDYTVFIQRAEALINFIDDDIRSGRGYQIRSDPYLMDLYLQINENIDFYAKLNNEHALRKKARQRNASCFLGSGHEQKWEYFLEEYMQRIALIDIHSGKFRDIHYHANEAIKCIEKIQQLKGFSEWTWSSIFEMFVVENYSKSMVIGAKDAHYLLTLIRAGLYAEKVCILKNRMIRNEPVLVQEAEERKHSTFRRWFFVYSQIAESGRMPSGINRRVSDLLVHYAGMTHEMDTWDRVIINESLYSIKQGLGFYREGEFHDSKSSTVIDDPIEYIKNIYLIRGFLEEKSFLNKDLVMKYNGFKIRITKVKSPEEIIEKVRSYKGKNDFFYYFILDQALEQNILDRLLDCFIAREKEIQWPATFRLVYETSPGYYGCPETFKTMI